MKVEIIFLRHGRSRADDEGRHEGRYDSPLTDTGREQVRRRGMDFKSEGITFDKIIASSLSRALETAHILGSILDSKVEKDDDWMEIDNGQLAGRTFEEAK